MNVPQTVAPDPATSAIPTPDEPSGAPLHQRIGRLAAVLASSHVAGSDRAALQRMVPGTAPPLAYYRLWLRHLADEVPDTAQTGAWMLLAAGLAASHAQANRPGRGFGQALAESGWHEARLERLLAADVDGQQLKLAADGLRFLAARGETFDWVDLARLLLARTDRARDAIHRRIATDFYRKRPRTGTKE